MLWYRPRYHQIRRLVKEPYGIAREIAALGYYYFFHLPGRA